MMWKPNVWQIERGGDFQILVHVLDLNSSPIDIAGASQVDLLLKNSDGTTTIIQATQGLACGIFNPIWIYAFPVTALQTAALPLLSIPTEIEVQVFWGSLNQKFTIESALTTFDPPI